MAHAKEVFERWIEPEVPWLVAYLAGMTGSRQLAEDLAQETLIRAFRAADSFDHRRTRDGSAAAWLRTIARNVYRNAVRDRRVQRQIDEGTTAVYEAAFRRLDELDDDRRRALRRCFDELPESLIELCRAHYHDDRSAPSIAEHLGLKVDAVRKRLQRARDALRACIERRLQQEEEPV